MDETLPPPASEPSEQPIHPKSGLDSNTPAGLVRQFYQDLVQLLTLPRSFFEHRYPRVSTYYALAFGIVVNWLAAVLSWMTRIVKHETLFDALNRMRDRLSVLPMWKSLPTDLWPATSDHFSLFPAWMTELFGITLSPFSTLMGFFFRSAIIFLGVYLLYPKEQLQEPRSPRDRPEYTGVLRITALVAAPNLLASLLGFMPAGLGDFVGGIYTLVILLIALSVRYRVSGLRAFAMVFLPGTLITVLFSCVLAVFAGIFFGGIAALFGVFQ